MTYAADDGVLDGYNTSCLNSRLLIHEKAEKNDESVYPSGHNCLALQIFISLQMLFIAPVEFIIGELVKIH